jgi:hypothetical protein
MASYIYLSSDFMRCILTLIFLAAIIACPASAFSIGAAPGVQYAGEFSPGDSPYIKFYLLTNAKSDVVATLSYMQPHIELYYPGKINQISAYEMSQEPIEQWINYQQNPVLVSPKKTIVATLEGGEVVKANAEVVYKLSIPKDAEPGYHVGSISFNPKVSSSGEGNGVATLGITRYIFIFKVRGVAERNGEIKSVYADRVEKNRARVDVLFKNTGKDTISVWIDSLGVYDETGNLVTTLNSGMDYVAPGETKILPVYWSDNNLSSGTYRADAKVSYITGFATKSVSIEIPIEPTVQDIESPGFNIPWWLILLIILIVILIIYWKY